MSPETVFRIHLALAYVAWLLASAHYHATQVDLPAMAGQLGNTYAIPIIYVPLLMITHGVAFHGLLRHPQVST